MTTIIPVIAAGILLISLEVFLPGGILGILGGIVVGIGVWLVYQEFGGAVAIWSGVLILLALLTLICIEVSIVRRTKVGKALLLQATQQGRTTTRETQAQLVGERGVTLTVLSPSGSVRINGEIYEAISEDGYIARDEEIRVVSQGNFRLVVERVKED